MSKLYYGSISLTELLAKAKEGHPSFVRANNGKIYVNVSLWLNDEKDQFGNSASMKISDKGEHKGSYIGNLKESEGARELTQSESNQLANSLEDLPF